jgi:hypothetical protein
MGVKREVERLQLLLQARLLKQQVQAHVNRLATELDMPAAEIMAEVDEAAAYYERHGRWPPDIAWAYRFTQEHGREPTLEEWDAAEKKNWA